MTRLSALRSAVSRWLAAGGVAVAAVAASGTMAHGGAKASRNAFCTFRADGSGSCSGTMQAWRSSSDPTAQLILDLHATSSGASRSFNVTFGGVNKVIRLVPPASAELMDTFDKAAASASVPTTVIFFRWNTGSQVEAIQLFNQSGLLP